MLTKKYIPTIGLEIHAELSTDSKMFCGCKNDPDEKRPNVNVCPVCMGHPGTLPVINKQAVKSVIKIGLAVGGTIADFTEWDRKNYFYPDIPKGYQISQYKYPLVLGGQIAGCLITRIHLEEDTAKSSHDSVDSRSLIDFNRSGLPLMELVTEPVIHDAETAVKFAKDLQRLLRYLGAGEANMEKGEMRVEANISVALEGDKELGTKTEVKNLNSFRVVEKAINYEVARQIEMLEKGEKIVQETRGWDDNLGQTWSQRVKESSHDYRYFPEPDLPKLKISEILEFSKDVLISEIPELPWRKREKLVKDFGLKEVEADIFVDSSELSDYLDKVIKFVGPDKKNQKLALNYLISDYIGILKKNSANYEELVDKISPENFALLIGMLGRGEIGSRGAKDTLVIMFEKGGSPDKIAESEGFVQKMNQEDIKKIAEDIIKNNPKVVSDYKAGKESSIQFFVGQGMKATKGSVNPITLKDIFTEILK